MKHLLIQALFLAVMLFISGCSTQRLPAEDLEVPVLYADIIGVLKDPSLPTNSEQKYLAAKKLLKYVDLTFTRETKTINELFHHRDALIDFPERHDRSITFNYQYRDNFVRIQFHTFRNFVLKVTITEK